MCETGYVVIMVLNISYFFSEKMIVHEFGHYRWGLKDEYWSPSQKGSEQFYLDSEMQALTATRCGFAVEGKVR